MKRPFAWLRPTLVGLGMMMAFVSLGSELLAHALFADGAAGELMRARMLGNHFFPWLFMPALLCIFLGGGILALGNGRLGYGLAWEPLRTRTGALMTLGLTSMLISLGLVAAGKMQSGWGDIASGIIMTVVWTPIMSMSVAQIWANDTGFRAATWWATKQAGRRWRAWLGIVTTYMVAVFVTSAIGLIISSIIAMQNLSLGAMTILGIVVMVTGVWIMSLAAGLNALVVLSMHQQGMKDSGCAN